MVQSFLFTLLHYDSEFVLFTSLHYGSEFVLYSPRVRVQEYWLYLRKTTTDIHKHTPTTLSHVLPHPVTLAVSLSSFSLIHLFPRLLSHSFTRALSHAVTLASSLIPLSLIHTCTSTRCDTHILTLTHRLSLLLFHTCFPHAVTLSSTNTTQHNNIPQMWDFLNYDFQMTLINVHRSPLLFGFS